MFDKKTIMNKNYLHLLLSTFLLFPTSIFLITSDGFYSVGNYYTGGLSYIIISLFLSLLIFGIRYLIRSKSVFIVILYKTSYIISVISFLLGMIMFLNSN